MPLFLNGHERKEQATSGIRTKIDPYHVAHASAMQLPNRKIVKTRSRVLSASVFARERAKIRLPPMPFAAVPKALAPDLPGELSRAISICDRGGGGLRILFDTLFLRRL
jgi:hypothetical protein